MLLISCKQKAKNQAWKTTTPPKRILWEPKNHPIEKEHYLNQPSMFGFKILVFQGVQSESCQTCVAFVLDLNATTIGRIGLL